MTGSTAASLHVTFVCTGNICRSPMAEALFNDYLEHQGETRVRVTSCGIGDWHVGRQPRPQPRRAWSRPGKNPAAALL